MAKVKINRAKLNDAIGAALLETADELSPLFNEAIEANIYSWPRTTERQSGEVVSSPRDIVDLGNLLGAKQVNPISSTRLQFSWDVDYALSVHNGSTYRNGTTTPPRPWTQVALDRFNFQQRYAENLSKRL